MYYLLELFSSNHLPIVQDKNESYHYEKIGKRRPPKPGTCENYLIMTQIIPLTGIHQLTMV